MSRYIETKELLKNSVANSSSFQTWVSAEDAAEAKDSIHTTGIAAGYTRPMVLITHGPTMSAERETLGAADGFLSSGSLKLAFEADRAGDSDITELESFATTVEAVIEDVLDRSGTAGYLAITRIEMTEEPGIEAAEDRQADETKESYCQCCYEVHWG